ncbi:MAG: hypothetical protein HQL82_01220 [Magnetococcales bacterium]|nr:hypothetical protein [Magnetococcales bacterium]
MKVLPKTKPGRGMLLILGLLVAAGCSLIGENSNFVHRELSTGFDLHVAVLPFENLSNNPTAGVAVSQLMATELYARKAFRIMEESEMRRRLTMRKVDMDRLADAAVARQVAIQLGVDAVLIGSVSEFAYQHGLREEPAVGVNVQLIRARDGLVMWRASQSLMGSNFWRRQSLIQTTQQAVNRLVDGLVGATLPEA